MVYGSAVLCHSLLQLPFPVVMIVVYHEGVDDKLCCSAEAGKRFAAGGQKDLQKYIDSDRLLTLKRDSPINSEQSTAIANFLQVDAVPTINSEQSTVIANFPRVDAVTTTDELFTGHKDEPITDQPLSQTQPPKVSYSIMDVVSRVYFQSHVPAPHKFLYTFTHTLHCI